MKYDSNEDNDKFGVTVPKWDGLKARIDHHGVNHASKTLGSMTCQSGCNRGVTLATQVKSEAWVATVKEGKLSQQDLWFMMKNQFWPRVAFGIGVSMASFDTLSECLMKPYYKIPSQGGVCSSIGRGLRQMHLGFYCWVLI